MRHPDIVFKPKFRINGHDLRYPIVYTTTRQFFFGHLNGLRMQKSGGQCCCLARLGFGFLAGVVALKPWLLLRGRRCTLHHLLTWNTKPAGHACLFDGPMTTQCDIFLSSVSCWLFLSMVFHQTFSFSLSLSLSLSPRDFSHNLRASHLV